MSLTTPVDEAVLLCDPARAHHPVHAWGSGSGLPISLFPFRELRYLRNVGPARPDHTRQVAYLDSSQVGASLLKQV